MYHSQSGHSQLEYRDFLLLLAAFFLILLISSQVLLAFVDKISLIALTQLHAAAEVLIHQ